MGNQKDLPYLVKIEIHLLYKTMVVNVLAQNPVSSSWWGVIEKVNSPYALYAFFFATCITALLMILHYTGGLKSVTDSLLKNAQLTSHQVERIYKFTVQIFFGLALALLIYLFLNTLISQNKSTSPKVTIDFPEQNEPLKVNTLYPVTKLRGTSENIPQNRKLWVFAYPVETNIFFPFDNKAVVGPNGSWSSNGVVGPINKPDIRYQFVVVGADEKARTQIEEYIKKKNEDSNNNTGVQSLPDGSATYSTVEVMYSPSK